MTDPQFKGAVHATAASLLAVMAAYNLLRLATAPERKHVLNVCIYAPLCLFEWAQTYQHWKQQA